MKYLILWLEHFLIIPIRWFKIHYRNWKNLNQRCKVCGNADKFNFYVSDEIWQKVVPQKYQNRVVCLACFDEFAEEMEVDYSTSIESVYFAGNTYSIKLRRETDQK